MTKVGPVVLFAIVALAGCTGSPDSGGAGPTVAAPKSASDLPTSMSTTDRKRAESGLGAAGMNQGMANDPARVKAMEEMKKQHGG